jgi:hypothetical protein
LPAANGGFSFWACVPLPNSHARFLAGGLHPEDAIVRLIGAILLEQDDEWAVERARYMTLETIAPLSDDPTVSLPAIAS